jgi:hypothetical protein
MPLGTWTNVGPAECVKHLYATSRPVSNAANCVSATVSPPLG